MVVEYNETNLTKFENYSAKIFDNPNPNLFGSEFDGLDLLDPFTKNFSK